MTRDQFTGIVRHLVSAAGGILLTLGAANVDTVDTVSGAVLALSAVVWSILEKSKRQTP